MCFLCSSHNPTPAPQKPRGPGPGDRKTQQSRVGLRRHLQHGTNIKCTVTIMKYDIVHMHTFSYNPQILQLLPMRLKHAKATNWQSKSTEKTTVAVSLQVSLQTALIQPTPKRTAKLNKYEVCKVITRALLGAPGHTTRNRNATRGLLALLLGARTLLGAPGHTTRNKNATRGSWLYY